MPRERVIYIIAQKTTAALAILSYWQAIKEVPFARATGVCIHVASDKLIRRIFIELKYIVLNILKPSNLILICDF